MQSSLFEPGRPVLVVVCVARKLRPCPSYSRRRDRINLGLWRGLYKGGGGVCTSRYLNVLFREILTKVREVGCGYIGLPASLPAGLSSPGLH